MTAQALAVHEAPTPPAWIRGEALAEWKRVTPELKRLGIISQLDRAMLTAYCSSWGWMVEAAKALREGAVIEGRRQGEPVKSPWWQIYRDAAGMVQTFGKDLGLTPASRARMTTTDPALEDVSDLD